MERFLVPEALWSLEAERQQLQNQPHVAARLREVLREAFVADVARQVQSEQPVTQDDLKRYYREHLEEFQTPKRIRLWWIVLRDKASAKRIIEEMSSTASVQRWMEVAREQSLDKGTRFRGGDLGFVAASGATRVPQLRVPAAIYLAANRVSDGQLVPRPVRVAQGHAVVWRRGTVAESRMPLETVRSAIQRAIEEQRVRARLSSLVTTLKRKHVSILRPSLLDLLRREGSGGRD